MNLEAELTRDQFTRIAILHHIQRRQFYFYALTAALVTVFAITQTMYILLLVAWVPFVVYLAIGIYGAYKESGDEKNMAFLKTRYKFSDTGIIIDTANGQGQLKWEQVGRWKIIADCYVLQLKNGPILAIPETAVNVQQTPKFKAILNKHIK
jgi:Ca2+/Na+ antiporter